MSGLKFFAFVLALALPLCAQEHQLSERQLGAYKGDDSAVRSLMNYCDALEDSFRPQPPHIFVQVASTSTSRSKHDTWRALGSKYEWEVAHRPGPLAFVWHQNGSIAGVTIVERPPRPGSALRAYHRVDYCYGVDARLIRIRSVWYPPSECEFLFPCRLISNREFALLGPRKPGVTDWLFMEDGATERLWNGKVVDDYFDPSNSLTAGDLHLKKSSDLPFHNSISK